MGTEPRGSLEERKRGGMGTPQGGDQEREQGRGPFLMQGADFATVDDFFKQPPRMQAAGPGWRPSTERNSKEWKEGEGEGCPGGSQGEGWREGGRAGGSVDMEGAGPEHQGSQRRLFRGPGAHPN